MRKAILAAVRTDDNIYFDELIRECTNLCDACGIEIIETIVQSSRSIEPNTAFRKGKIEELRQLIEENDVEVVVFYNNLSINIVSNLEELLNIQIIDRTNLILDIFSSRARSREAMIQSEVARLKYSLPQYLKSYTDEDKQRGGSFNNRGSGESRSALIRRKMERRISDLNRELQELDKRKEAQSASRSKTIVKKVALVGYTNAGKSSLMNVLLKRNDKEDKSVYEKDQLFATLDTSVRNIRYRNYEFLLFDTVGFVSDLPHELIEAFKSTLKAAKEADLLVHVMDASNSNFDLLRQITKETLEEIGAWENDMIDVFNKCDLLEEGFPQEGICVSCLSGQGIEMLLEEIVKRLYPDERTVKVLIPYEKFGIISGYRKLLTFKECEEKEEGTLYQITGSNAVLEELLQRV